MSVVVRTGKEPIANRAVSPTIPSGGAKQEEPVATKGNGLLAPIGISAVGRDHSDVATIGGVGFGCASIRPAFTGNSATARSRGNLPTSLTTHSFCCSLQFGRGSEATGIRTLR